MTNSKLKTFQTTHIKTLYIITMKSQCWKELHSEFTL